jgi:hypothetical protein
VKGDYRIGETLLAESASIITLCDTSPSAKEGEVVKEEDSHLSLHIISTALKNRFSRSRTPSPDPELTSLPPPPTPRRLVVLVLGLKPHRKFWTTSARPGESVINYTLFNGCPAIVIPVKIGAPLVAWYGNMTLEQLWQVELPEKMESSPPTTAMQVDDNETGVETFVGIVHILFEYLDLCADWSRVNVPSTVAPPGPEETGSDSTRDAPELQEKRKVLRDSLALLVSAAIRSGRNKEVAEEVDETRGGIAMWRIP